MAYELRPGDKYFVAVPYALSGPDGRLSNAADRENTELMIMGSVAARSYRGVAGDIELGGRWHSIWVFGKEAAAEWLRLAASGTMLPRSELSRVTLGAAPEAYEIFS